MKLLVTENFSSDGVRQEQFHYVIKGIFKKRLYRINGIEAMPVRVYGKK